ncbi:MAG TPA: ABC transporter permease, partial [Bacteroidia bacterium]|nr:ABC transporter permease [Bacteroidia bacterium]
MGKYIFKRVLVFIPTLLAISVLIFIISVNSPGDPIERMLNMNGGGDGQVIDKLASEKAYRTARHNFGLDLPLFYCSITNATCPDTLFRIQDENHRNTLERLSFEYGHWNEVAIYYQAIRGYELGLLHIPRSKENADPVNLARTCVMGLYDSPDDSRIQSLLRDLERIQENPELSDTQSSFSLLRKSYTSLLANRSSWRRYIPVIHWYGFENQYHRWFSHFICGDFGISYQNQRPVSSILKEAWPWTAGISLFSILLAYLISIPLGVKSVLNKGKRSERVTTTALFALYSLPSFWIGTLCVIFLCGGDWLNIFPGPGAEPVSSDASAGYKA